MYALTTLGERTWPAVGPFILLERYGGSGAWRALDVSTSRCSTVVPSDENMFYRIA